MGVVTHFLRKAKNVDVEIDTIVHEVIDFFFDCQHVTVK